MDDYKNVIQILKKHLKYETKKENPFKVLICMILSQRTRDEITNSVCESLFRRFKNKEGLRKARVDEIYKVIKQVGFAKQKAKWIKQLAEIDKVPNTTEELTKLLGVGQKTAGCVLVYGFGIPEIPVDTHVHRISNRLGWVFTKTPEQTRKELKKKVPKKLWIDLNGVFVKFGQQICKPTNPKCNICPIKDYCRFFKNSISASERPKDLSTPSPKRERNGK